MKKAFPIGSLDKTKTAAGWVSVKKMQQQGGEDISTIKLSDAPDILGKALAEMNEEKKIPHTGKFTTIYDAQVAWLKKEITHKDFLREQAGLYSSGTISKKHSNVKIK